MTRALNEALMGKPFHHPYHLLLLLIFFSLVHHSNQLQSSQYQSLVVLIQQLLNYPFPLTSFSTVTDLCNIEPTPSLTLVCYEDNITQIHIIGKNGFPPLPQNFSTESFFSILSTLSSLKVLSLVSLGLEGPLPTTVTYLSSLEIFNLSSNHFSGTIPVQVSSLKCLQTLILDHNKFSGEVPVWLSSLPLLAVLSLSNNSFNGSLPNSLSKMENLRILSVSRNNLSGEVPDLQNLTNLQVVDLQDNYFGPHFPILHTRIVSVLLKNNSFQLGIPNELLASCYQLQRLDISLNGFVGPFSPSLFSLPSISYINISNNKFTGMLSENMSCNSDIAYVDISSNLLNGDLPSCLEPNSKSKVIHYYSNCLSSHHQYQHPSSFCHKEALAVEPLDEDQEKHNRPKGKAVIASTTIGGAIGAIAIVGMVLLLMKRVYICSKKHRVKEPQARVTMENVSSSVNTVKLLSDARHISETMKLGANLPAYRTFALEELKEATNNFDESNLLSGASHNKIYRGRLGDGTVVTISRFSVKKKKCQQQSIRHQIELISKLRHSHLVSSLGHCLDWCMDDSTISQIFLIFEFVSDQTLRDHTSSAGPGGKKLSWKQRIGAAIGITKGIQFLHTGLVPAIYSNNLNITEVLLDHDLHVKLSCHNLPLLAETRRSVGTSVFSPGPKQNILTREKDNNGDKKDVYDLGVILVEIIVGRPITSPDEVAVVKNLDIYIYIYI
ncbi:probable inactive leucine-rich repeat receptor-like protein kinase At3g03770 isoform X2 [Jatropha curcas]|uniref:probable inactive leucine-rich repeat receptor-like protein kinase At3g03770 isoform X2 n=1 Tax=Jatropha curcas TaxID=180498 RepID=UPI00189388F3|nr:probable inactive leucine-rich repeat receptor-like protein kinase At3g03770 isoform X2 [Jatropha curcas]